MLFRCLRPTCWSIPQNLLVFVSNNFFQGLSSSSVLYLLILELTEKQDFWFTGNFIIFLKNSVLVQIGPKSMFFSNLLVSWKIPRSCSCHHEVHSLIQLTTNTSMPWQNCQFYWGPSLQGSLALGYVASELPQEGGGQSWGFPALKHTYMWTA